MSTHNLCFEQKYEKYQNFLSENFPFLIVKFSIYLNRSVFVMEKVCPSRDVVFKPSPSLVPAVFNTTFLLKLLYLKYNIILYMLIVYHCFDLLKISLFMKMCCNAS